MPVSGCPRLSPFIPTSPLAIRPLLCAALLLLAGCAGKYQGTTCNGEVTTLSGQPLGTVEGKIIDRVSAFSVTLPDRTLDSGPLWSGDRQLYIPSAVTRDGWLAQRVSDTRFSIINSPQDRAITFTCPGPGGH
ncbi:hypothetical protein [Erwinia sp. E602]|uniref:hypothetical protein n=1 Tax=Erwinia sp. E602 TaxID=2675378 RepID=UPI002012C6EC|nr:hypothetical protein [Erwinia sp. E602]